MDDLAQQDVAADGLLRHRAHGIAHALDVAADHLDVVFHLHALGLQLIGKLLEVLVDLLVDHAGGDVAGHVLAGQNDSLVLKVTVNSFLTLLGEVGLDALLEGGQRVVFGDVLGELVVELGLDGLLDLVDLALEGRGLAGQLLGVALGEGDLDGLLFTGLQADELIFEAGDERAGAERQGIALGLAAVEGLAVDKAFKVQNDGVAGLGFAVNGLDAGVAVLHAAELCVDFGLGDGNGLLGDLDALVLAEGDLGVELSGNGQHDAAVFGGLHIGNGGLADGLELLLDNGSFVDLGEDLVDSVFIEDLRAVHPLDELARGLALAEAGDHDILTDLGIGLVQSSLELVPGDLDGDLCGAVFFLYVFDVHCGTFLLCGAAHEKSRYSPFSFESALFYQTSCKKSTVFSGIYPNSEKIQNLSAHPIRCG